MNKVSDEHLLEIKKHRETLAEIISAIGELNLNKLLVTKQLADVNSLIESQEKRFTEFQESERVLYETLQTTYGTGTINIETGEIAE